MPELPEVETLARGLRPQILGRRIVSVVLYRASILSTPPALLEQLHDAQFTALHRAGKYLIFELTADGRSWQLLVHLGMTGQLLLRPSRGPISSPERNAGLSANSADPEAAEGEPTNGRRLGSPCAVSAGRMRRSPKPRQAVPVLPHTHLVATLTGGAELHFRDPRRFGRIALAPAPSGGEAFSPALGIAPGAEPLEISPEAFVALFHTRQAPIKSALMNQRLLRGLGNIYADESLFRAAIHPRAHLLSAPRLRRLRLAIRHVLLQAIAAGGSSISDYVDSRGQPGWFQLRHCVYGRAGQPCPRCGAAIRSLVLAGRTAHYCPHCQKR